MDKEVNISFLFRSSDKVLLASSSVVWMSRGAARGMLSPGDDSRRCSRPPESWGCLRAQLSSCRVLGMSQGAARVQLSPVDV